MEVAYSVGVSNRFASLMADDDDPGDEVITPTNAPEKVERDKKKDVKGGKPKVKDNREKAQQTRKSVQDSTKQMDKPPTAGRGRGGRQDNRRNQGAPGEEREFYPRGEGRGGRGGRGGRPRLSSRDKENDGGFSGERGFSGGDRGFSGGDRGFSGGDRGGDRGFSGGDRGGDRGFSGGDRGDREDRGEGRGRGMGRFRGGRGGGGGGGRGGFRGKREFERRSGSDKSSVKAVEKREGGGAHNWGKREDIDDWPEDGEEPQQPPTATGQTEGEPNGDAPTTEKTEEPISEQTESIPKETEEDNQPKEMTLDEYKALMSKNSKETIRQDVDERKPGENVDSSQWKDTIIYERTEGEYFPGTREVIEKPKTSGRIKTTLDANFYFRDPARRGGRGRSGEQGGRGGRGRGGEGGRGRGRGEGRNRDDGRSRDEGKGEGRRFRSDRRDHGKAPNVEDKLDFPTLPGAPQTAVEQ